MILKYYNYFNKKISIQNLEKNPLERPNQYSTPEFLDPTKRLSQEENELLHEVMQKLGVLMLKYRVIPKSYFRDAVNIFLPDLILATKNYQSIFKSNL